MSLCNAMQHTLFYISQGTELSQAHRANTDCGIYRTAHQCCEDLQQDLTHLWPQHPTCVGADWLTTHLLQLLDDVGSCCLCTAADGCDDSCLQPLKEAFNMLPVFAAYIGKCLDCRLSCMSCTCFCCNVTVLPAADSCRLCHSGVTAMMCQCMYRLISCCLD